MTYASDPGPAPLGGFSALSAAISSAARVQAHHLDALARRERAAQRLAA